MFAETSPRGAFLFHPTLPNQIRPFCGKQYAARLQQRSFRPPCCRDYAPLGRRDIQAAMRTSMAPLRTCKAICQTAAEPKVQTRMTSHTGMNTLAPSTRHTARRVENKARLPRYRARATSRKPIARKYPTETPLGAGMPKIAAPAVGRAINRPPRQRKTEVVPPSWTVWRLS